MPWVQRWVQVTDAELAAEAAAANRGEMTASQACDELGCSRSRLNALALSGVVRFDHRLGRTWFDAADVRELASGGEPSIRHRREAAEGAETFEAFLGPRAARPAETPAPGPERHADTFLGGMRGGDR